MATTAAILLARERRVVEALRLAGATSASTARPAHALGLDPDGVALRRLRRRAVVREAAPEVYYVDLESWRAVRALRRQAALVLLAVGALVAYLTLRH